MHRIFAFNLAVCASASPKGEFAVLACAGPIRA
jgi:hypothetical protein